MADPTTSRLTDTDSGPLAGTDANGRLVHRVGYAPDPWAWTPWQYATDGRFGGRWDDPDGLWRSLYVGGSQLACYVELLAAFRPDPVLSLELDNIDEQPEDAAKHPTLGFGLLPRAWLEPRRLGTATLRGWYAVPGGSQSLRNPARPVPGLGPQPGPARSGRCGDPPGRAPPVDSAPRRLAVSADRSGRLAVGRCAVRVPARRRTRAVGGVRTRRRHPQLRPAARQHQRPLDPRDPELTQALQLHRLTWTG